MLWFLTSQWSCRPIAHLGYPNDEDYYGRSEKHTRHDKAEADISSDQVNGPHAHPVGGFVWGGGGLVRRVPRRGGLQL